MRWANGNAAAVGSGAIYRLGMFGAWVWFWQRADALWGYMLAVFQGISWPAFMVSRVFEAVGK